MPRGLRLAQRAPPPCPPLCPHSLAQPGVPITAEEELNSGLPGPSPVGPSQTLERFRSPDSNDSGPANPGALSGQHVESRREGNSPYIYVWCVSHKDFRPLTACTQATQTPSGPSWIQPSKAATSLFRCLEFSGGSHNPFPPPNFDWTQIPNTAHPCY